MVLSSSELDDLVAYARERADMARGGDFSAGMETVAQSAIAIRSLLAHGRAAVDPFRQVFLDRFLESLDAIAAGHDPLDALALRREPNRMASAAIPLRNGAMFTEVGEEIEALIARGNSRQDKPTQMAIQAVAAKWKVSEALVSKVWSDMGGAKGWAACRDDWKGDENLTGNK